MKRQVNLVLSKLIWRTVAQSRMLAMAQCVIDLVPLLDGFGDLFGGPIEHGSPDFQRAGDLTLAVGIIGPTQLSGQFHLLRWFSFPSNPGTFLNLILHR